MSTLKDIEDKTKAFAEANDRLAELVDAVNEAIARAKQMARAEINRALKRAAVRKAELHAAIEAAPALFVKPRTVIFHGVKVGFAKGKGKVTFKDADKVVALIKKVFPDKADVLVITEEKPNKEGIAALSVDDVKKIGCAVEGTGDVVVIKTAKTDLEKAVDALFKDFTEEAEAEA